MKSALAVALVSAMLLPAPQTFSPDADGFIRNWLVLAPMAIDRESGATAIDKEFLNGETSAAPNARHKVAIGGKVLTWTPHQTSDYYIDFLQSFDAKRGEYVAGYAVAYVIARSGPEQRAATRVASSGVMGASRTRCRTTRKSSARIRASRRRSSATRWGSCASGATGTLALDWPRG